MSPAPSPPTLSLLRARARPLPRMAARLSGVVLLVRDVARSAALYRDALGLSARASTGAQARFALADGAELTVRAASSEAQCSAGYAPLLSFEVPDMDRVVPALLAHGAALDGGVRYNPYGRTAAVRTPDGHMLGLFEPAGLPADGDRALAAAAAAKRREEVSDVGGAGA